MNAHTPTRSDIARLLESATLSQLDTIAAAVDSERRKRGVKSPDRICAEHLRIIMSAIISGQLYPEDTCVYSARNALMVAGL